MGGGGPAGGGPEGAGGRPSLEGFVGVVLCFGLFCFVYGFPSFGMIVFCLILLSSLLSLFFFLFLCLFFSMFYFF